MRGLKVLVGVDASIESDIALRYVCQLLGRSNAWVETLYVKMSEADISPEYFYSPFFEKQDLLDMLEAEADAVEERVETTCRTCREGGAACIPRVVVGDPADEILNAANTRGCDMIVLGFHRRSALRGFLMGAVHWKILHHARQPVMIVRTLRSLDRVLVAYRGSQCDQSALEFIAPLLADRKPEITVLHVRESTRGENEEFGRSCLLEADQTLRRFEHSPVTKMVAGDFVDEIVKEIAAESYDLVVLGAYGHHRPRFLRILSDEALDLVRMTTLPVLVYREKE